MAPGLRPMVHSGDDAATLAGARAAIGVEAQYGGVVRNAAAENRMRRVGLRLTRNTPEIRGIYVYRLLQSNRSNAVSLPGGRLYVTRGLYNALTSDEHLAAVLAHEIAHIALKDHFKPRSESCGSGLDREIAADARAALYLRNAGIDAETLIDVIRLVEDAQPMGWSDLRERSLRAEGISSHSAPWRPPARAAAGGPDR